MNVWPFYKYRRVTVFNGFLPGVDFQGPLEQGETVLLQELQGLLEEGETLLLQELKGPHTHKTHTRPHKRQFRSMSVSIPVYSGPHL